jgi:putative Holliday junction resolvase
MPRKAAIDYGLKRIGLAISDEKAQIALPLKMVMAGPSLRATAALVLAALGPYQGRIDMIVIGLPIHLNGARGEMAKAVERFVDEVRKQTTVAIQTMDERLTTSQAERDLKELSYSRKERSQRIDVASAVILLQTFLDKNA